MKFKPNAAGKRRSISRPEARSDARQKMGAARAAAVSGRRTPDTSPGGETRRFFNSKLKFSAAADITIERTLKEVARVAYADPGRLFNPDGSMKAIADMDADTRALIASVETTEEQGSTGEDGQAGSTIRTRKVKLWDKNSALEKLLKHLGLYEKGNAQARENLAIQVVFVDPPPRPPDPMELEVERGAGVCGISNPYR
jgi:hypothetical protein